MVTLPQRVPLLEDEPANPEEELEPPGYGYGGGTLPVDVPG
jgi:hypothetical protein